MAEQTAGMPANADDRPSAQAGVATEMTASEPLTPERTAAFGHWLTGKLNADPDVRDRVAMHSGLPVSDIVRLLDGQAAYQLTRDEVQRIASALVEMGIAAQADEVWTAAGLGGSDYVVPPMQVVQAMSRDI